MQEQPGMKKFNGCLVTAIQKNFRIKNFFFKLEEMLKLLLMKENQNPKIALIFYFVVY